LQEPRVWISSRRSSERNNRKMKTSTKPLIKACSDTMKGLSIGCFLLEFIAPNGQGETVTMHRFQHSVSIMDTKDNVFNMHQRFFSAEERKSVVFDPNEH